VPGARVGGGLGFGAGGLERAWRSGAQASAGGRRERARGPPGGAGSGCTRARALGAGVRRGRAGHRQASRTRAAAGPAGRRGALRWHRPGGVPGRGWVGDGAGLTPAGGARSWAGAGLTPGWAAPPRALGSAMAWVGGGFGVGMGKGGEEERACAGRGGGPGVEGGVGNGPSPATVSHGRRLFVIKDLRRKHVLQYRFAGQHCGSNRSLLLIFTSLLPITATFLLPLLPVVHHYYVKTGPLLLIITAVFTSFLLIITSVITSLLPVVPVIMNPLLQ